MYQVAYAHEVCAGLEGGNRVVLLDAFGLVKREAFLFSPPWRCFRSGSDWNNTCIVTEPQGLYHDMLVRLVDEDRLNSSQPSLWASVFHWTDVRPGMTVFQSGAGLGYFTAVLAHVVGEDGQVYYEELHSKLKAPCRANLSSFQTVSCDYHEAPLDRVYLCYGTTTLPQSLWEAGRLGCRYAFPFTDEWGAGRFLGLEKTEEGCELHLWFYCSFSLSATYRTSRYINRMRGLKDMAIAQRLVDLAMTDDDVLDVAKLAYLALCDEKDE